MKIFQVTLPILIVVACSFVGMSQENYRESDELVGLVHTVRISFADVKNGVEQPYGGTLIITYSRNGNKIARADYATDGSFLSTTTYKYDNKERLIEEVTDIASNTQSKRITYTYDDQCKSIDIIRYQSGKMGWKETYIFDSDYDLEKYKHSDASLMTAKWIEHRVFDKNGKIAWKVTAENTTNQRIENYQYYMVEPLDRLKMNGRKIIYAYDNQGKIKGCSYYNASGELIHQDAWFYRPDGLIAKIADYDDAGKLKDRVVWNYEFDSTGNWVKRTDLQFGNAHIEYRNIIYY
jgi:hypothetical protein